MLVFYLSVSLLVVVGCGNQGVPKQNRYELIAADQYETYLAENPNRTLIDVRTPGEFNKGHIEGAININFLGTGFKKTVRKLDADKPVFVYCQTAHRSPMAAKRLYKSGFSFVHDLEGGFKLWKESGRPVIVPGP